MGVLRDAFIFFARQSLAAFLESGREPDYDWQSNTS
jgi:hypothetical protein